MLVAAVQVSEPIPDTYSGTLQYCPELADLGDDNRAVLANVDKPLKPQLSHQQLSSQSFNLQYELVSLMPFSTLRICFILCNTMCTANAGIPLQLKAAIRT